MPTVQAAELLRRAPTAWGPGAQTESLIELVRTAPAFPPEFVRRDELVRRLSSTRHSALAMLIAPPGYGKSSLLAEWAEHDDRQFFWLGLDCAEGPRVVDSLSVVPRALRSLRGSSVVALDDAHLVEPRLLREIIDSVWSCLPPGSIFALASRTEPELPLGRLRAHRALVEIGMADLAMTSAQAAVLLGQAGFELDFESAQSLVRLTEGWPAAMYLAALSLREHSDAPDGIAGFRGDNHLLSEYLHDEVLGGLPADLMSFLMRTSVLDQLSGALCDSVLQERGSAVTLASIARISQLLEPRDPAHASYRWHSLFRQTLSGELRRADPQLEGRLHARASAWYSEHGDVDRAIDHAAASHDAQRTGELLWKNLVSYLTRGRGAQVSRWLDEFSHDRIAGTPALALCAAHLSMASGNVEEAQRRARDAVAASEGGELQPSSFSVGLAVIEAVAARTGVAGMLLVAESADQAEPENSPWRPVCRWLRGVARHLNGDRQAAAGLLVEAIEFGADAVPTVTILCLAQSAMIAIEDQDWELATEGSDQAIAMIAAHELSDEPIMALAFAASAMARARVGRSDEAKQDLRTGINLLAALGDSILWYGAQARILLAHASLCLADVVGARTLLAQASRLARRTPDAVIFQQWFDDAWSYMDSLAETRLAGPSALTIAELRILRFLPSHRPFREIAEQLGVSANTVKTQAHAVYRKLGAASRSDAVARAQDAGLLGH